MRGGKIFHGADPSTASASGTRGSRAADSGLRSKEVEMRDEGDLHALDDTNHTIIDTAAPFESVKAAVTRFKGDVKTEEPQITEKQKIGLQIELKKIQEETFKYQKKYEEIEASKEQIQKEVDGQTKFVEDLQLKLEKAETEEEQAKLDCQLVLLRLKEVEDGIDSSDSAAIKAQVQVAKERHTTAVAELESVSHELKSVQSDYALLLQERDLAVKRAAEIDSSSKESDKSVNDAALKLMKARASMESACEKHLGAEERKAAAALSLEIEKMVLNKAVEHAKEEVVRLEQDSESDEDSAASATGTLKLEEAQSEIEKAKHRISCLRTELHSLLSDLETQKASSTVLSEKEDLASATIYTLEEDLRRMDQELQLAVLSREETHKEEIETMLNPALEEAEKAKMAVDSAREELKMAKQDAEVAAAAATSLEERIIAAHGQIGEANKAIESLESPETKSAHAGDDSSNGEVTMTLEEFNKLKEKADLVDQQKNLAAEPAQISSEELSEAKRSLKEKKRVLEEAIERALMEEEEAILMEQQMRSSMGEKEVATEEMDEGSVMPDLSNIKILSDDDGTQADGVGDEDEECLDGDGDGDIDVDGDGDGDGDGTQQPDLSSAEGRAAERRRRKRVSLTRVVMFLSKKKGPQPHGPQPQPPHPPPQPQQHHGLHLRLPK